MESQKLIMFAEYLSFITIQILNTKVIQINIQEILKPIFHIFVLLKIIKLMNHLPSFRTRNTKFKRFNNVLSGPTYDNSTFIYSCSSDVQNNTPQQTSSILKHQESNATFMKHRQSKSFSINTDKLVKIESVTKRLSGNKIHECSKDKLKALPYNSMFLNKVSKSTAIERSESLLIGDTKRRKSIFTKDFANYKFEDIEILAMDGVHNFEDVVKKIIRINFLKYFTLYFKGDLVGNLTSKLIQITEKHIQTLIINETINNQPNFYSFPAELFCLSSKKSLLSKISELQQSKKYDQVDALIRYYCLPSKQLRQSFLADTILMLKIDVFEKFNLSRDCEYVLLNQYGKQIQDFAEIKFSTKKLFLSQRGRENQNFEIVRTFALNHKKDKVKFCFREDLKSKFRERIVKGRVYEKKSTRQTQNPEKNQERLKIAEKIIFSRNQKMNNTRKKFKQFLHSDKTLNGQSKSISKSKSIGKIKRMEKESQEVLFSLFDKTIWDQFLQIQRINYRQNPKIKEFEERQIQIKALINNSIFFMTKSRQQTAKILFSCEIINDALKFDQEMEKTITFQQYSKIRYIINCKSKPQQMAAFFDKFMDYDEYYQIGRQNLQKTIFNCLNKDGRNTKTVIQVIWEFFIMNKLLVNEAMRRDQFNTLYYSHNKPIIYLLISIIFDTCETDPVALARQIVF